MFPSLLGLNHSSGVFDGRFELGGQGGWGVFPLPYPDASAFHAMVIASVNKYKHPPSCFVKKLEEMSNVSLPPTISRKKSLALNERGLVKKFMGS
jgi:hypothetical protein